MSFATLPGAAPVRVALVGAGDMGRSWLKTLRDSPDVELVALVDLDVDLATKALADLEMRPVTVGRSLTEVSGVNIQAVVNVTVPAAHLPVGLEALRLGLPVLSEKPIAPTVAEAKQLANAAREAGQLLMTSQSRRYYGALARYRAQIKALGDIGSVTTQFYKAPRFGGFREQMQHVLLVDMAIHSFDTVRYLIDREPVAVWCQESNPSWSWFADGASAIAIFEFEGGALYTYTGSWCADGLETSWNGSWRVNGAHGTAAWDGDAEPEVQLTEAATPPELPVADGPEEIAGALAEFVSALRSGATPSGEVHSNILSLAMVEAAVRSAEEDRRVTIAEVLAS